MARLMRIAAATLTVSAFARLLTGYAVRGWNRLRGGKKIAVDVVTPEYAPAMVIRSEDFWDESDPLEKILEDGFHTDHFRCVAWLETVRRGCMALSLGVMLTAFLLWLRAPED